MKYTTGEVIHAGDIVKVGKRGTVKYEVKFADLRTDQMVSIQSQNTGRYSEKHASELVLIEKAHAPLRTVEEIKTARGDVPVSDDTAQVEALGAKLDPRTSPYGKAILSALNVLGKHVYQGTAKNRTKRARAKLAKKARRNARRANTARFLEISNAEGDK